MLTEQSEIARSLLAKARSFGLEGLKVELMQRHLFEKGESRVDSRLQLTGKGDYDKVQQLKGALEGREKEIALSIDSSPSIGDTCPSLDLVKTSDQSKVALEFSPDKVYLLDFWATWCGPCQGPMQHNQDMLSNNPAWEGKVEIVAIALDDDANGPETRMNQRGWTKVSSYWAPQGFESNAAQRFAVEGIPFCVLVHGGKILWKGHPSELNLEQGINSLIEGKQLDLPPTPPKEGDVCPPIKCKVIADESEKVLEFAESDNRVYFVDFWATWCGPCQGPMQHNQDMLNNNPAWEGKAEILGISLDQKKEDLVKRITDQGWDKVTHYWAGPLGFKESAPSSFGVDGIPCCLLVHQGKILWRGHPSERKLEADINSLIRGEGLVQAASESQPIIPLEEFNQKMETIKQMHNSYKEAHPNSEFPTFICFPNRTIELDKEDVETYRFILAGEFKEKQRAALQTIIDEIKQLFPATDERIEWIAAEPTIERAANCSLCNKALTPADTQYICLFCDPQHAHCQECQNAPREGAGSAKLAHPHSVYEVTAASRELDELRFGRGSQRINAVLDQDPASRTHRGVGCDNRGGECPGEVVGLRWKCAHCADYDFCDTCHSKWGPEASEGMINTAKSKGHEVWHVMFAIPFPN